MSGSESKVDWLNKLDDVVCNMEDANKRRRFSGIQ